MRSNLERGSVQPAEFRSALLAVPYASRDAWVDVALGLGAIPDDGPELPRDCVAYLPCSVDVLLRLVERVPVQAADIVVDIGSGLGRAAALMHLLSGATVVGIEVQHALVQAAREVTDRLGLTRVSFVEGEASGLAATMPAGTVYFLYCPFSGERLARTLDGIEAVARSRRVSVCAVDLPLPQRPWLALDPQPEGDLTIHRAFSG
jgi:SAM-dependent methyltransferase